MLSPRQSRVALAAVTAALAVAVPAASASAATTTRAVTATHSGRSFDPYALAPLCGMVIVPVLGPLLQAAQASGNVALANALALQLSTLCPPA
jgi:hypothetical protein